LLALSPLIQEARGANFTDVSEVGAKASPVTRAPATLRTDVRGAVATLDSEGKILTLSPTAADLFGVTPEVAGNRPLGNFVRAEDREAMRSALSRARLDGRSEVTVAPMRTDGKKVAVSAAFEQTSTGLVGWFHDVTAMSNRLGDAERDRDVARSQAEQRFNMVADTAHELRTPLNAIMGFADLLRNGVAGKVSAKQKSYLNLIHESGAHLSETVESTLDMSAIERGGFEPKWEQTDLREPVNAALNLLAQRAGQSGLDLTLDADDEPVLIETDARMVRQIAVNLIGNALKFTPEGGKVRVSVSREGDHGVLRVRDDGPGVPAEVLDDLGERFIQAQEERTKRRGSGLGLSIVKSFAVRLGGSLDVTNIRAGGTDAAVKLPAKQR
jgi:two-component system, cell cycle sensor histidine kinase DivJ